MKATSIYTMAALLTLGLAACNNNELDDPLADGPVPLTVTGEISAVATRATSNGFEEGDQIGIFPLKNDKVEGRKYNLPYTCSGTGFDPADSPYYFQDRERVTFCAYYPYQQDLESVSDYQIEIYTKNADQTTITVFGKNTWRKNDYLWASTTAYVGNPKVSYTDKTDEGGDNESFHHVMSQVVFVFKAGDGITDLSQLTGYRIATPLIVWGNFYPTTGKVEANTASTKEPIAMDITDASGAVYTCTTPLILLPQPIEDGKLDLEVTYNGQTYKASLDAPANNQLKSGESYTYEVTIKNTKLEVSEAKIKEWTETTPMTGNATLQ